MENILGKRIELERTRLGLNQIELAKKLNLSSSASISQYESGDRFPSDDIKMKMAEIFNCSIDYLLGKTDVRNNQKSAVVLVYGTIPAGIPMEMIENILDTEEIDANMLKGGKEYFGLRVSGNSMYPDYLDGDTIILEKVDDCESGQDCVVMVNGNDGTFKKVIKDEVKQTIKLQPINTTLDNNGNFLYEPVTFSKEEIEKLPVRVIGRVVELRRKK